jgi:hypothetical protein
MFGTTVYIELLGILNLSFRLNENSEQIHHFLRTLIQFSRQEMGVHNS